MYVEVGNVCFQCLETAFLKAEEESGEGDGAFPNQITKKFSFFLWESSILSKSQDSVYCTWILRVKYSKIQVVILLTTRSIERSVFTLL